MSMNTPTIEQYLALSSLSYESNLITLSGNKLSLNKAIELANIDANRPELRPLSSLSRWTLINAQTTPSGMSAIAVQNPHTKQVVFAYRGTDLHQGPVAMVKDFVADAQVAIANRTLIGNEPGQFGDAFRFYTDTLRALPQDQRDQYSFTGHSLGGGLAQYMGYITNGAGRAVAFGAPGIGQVLPAGSDPAAHTNTITNYVHQNDVIGAYGTPLGKTIYLKSDQPIHMNQSQVMAAAVLQAGKEGRVPRHTAALAAASMMHTGNVPAWVGGTTVLEAHKPGSLLDENGQLRAMASGSNVTELAASLYQTYNVTLGAVVDGVVDVAVTIGDAVWQATVAIGESIAEAAYQVATLPQYLADLWHTSLLDEVAISASNQNDTLYAVSAIQKLYPQMSYQAAAKVAVYIQALDGDDKIYINGERPGRVDGGSGHDRLAGGIADDTLRGQAGNDLLIGSQGHDALLGGGGDDTMYGDHQPHSPQVVDWHDVLDGGSGNDRLEGGAGNDTYVFGRGYGVDVVEDYARHPYYSDRRDGGANDTLRLSGDVTPQDVRVHRHSWHDLELSLHGSDDRVQIRDFFAKESPGPGVGAIEAVRFANGVVWDWAIIAEKARTILRPRPHDQPGTLRGYDHQNDVIIGTSGGDTLYGLGGGDRLEGSAGDDTLYGDGAYYARDQDVDFLDGGEGNDHLYGGNGDDVYTFGPGYGRDVIDDHAQLQPYGDRSDGGNDTLRMLAGIAPDDVLVRRESDSIVLAIKGSQDSVTIERAYRYGGLQGTGRIEKLAFADGTTWDHTTLYEKAAAPQGVTAMVRTQQLTQYMAAQAADHDPMFLSSQQLNETTNLHQWTLPGA